jgi:hypothetical protein
MTLAHQYRGQLPPEIRAGVDANARNKIIFGLNGTDAKEIAHFAPELTPDDFMMLPRYQVYTNIMQNRRATGWMQGVTKAPDPPIRMAAELKAESMKRYGKPAEEVDQGFLTLYDAVQEKSNADTADQVAAPDAPSRDANLGRGS